MAWRGEPAPRAAAPRFMNRRQCSNPLPAGSFNSSGLRPGMHPILPSVNEHVMPLPYGQVKLREGERGALVPWVPYNQVRLDVPLTQPPQRVA